MNVEVPRTVTIPPVRRDLPSVNSHNQTEKVDGLSAGPLTFLVIGAEASDRTQERRTKCGQTGYSANDANYRTTSEFSIDAGLVTAPIGVGLPT